MILARGEYDYPNTDWKCKTCGMAYGSAGYPDETRCMEGHGSGWVPRQDQMEAYIDVLKSLEEGDGVVICGDGPAPLMGPVKEVNDNEIVTESIDSPSMTIRWDYGMRREDDHASISWQKTEKEYESFSDDVYHVETVEVIG